MKNFTKSSIVKLGVFLIAFSMNAHALLAQDSKSNSINIPSEIIVSEASFELDGIARNGYSISISGNEKEIMKSLKEKLKNTYGLKMSSKSNQLRVEDALATELSDKHFSLVTELNSSASDYKLIVWMSLGTDVYVGSSTYLDESNRLKSFIRSYVIDYYNGYLDVLITDQTDLVSKSQKDMSKLTSAVTKKKKSQSKELKKIAKAKTKIQKAEAKIAGLNATIVDQQQAEKEAQNNADELAKEIEQKNTEIATAKTEITKLNTDLNELKRQASNLKGMK